MTAAQKRRLISSTSHISQEYWANSSSKSSLKDSNSYCSEEYTCSCYKLCQRHTNTQLGKRVRSVCCEELLILQNFSRLCQFVCLLRASCLKLEIKKYRCHEATIEESEKGRQPLGVEPRTPGLSHQCSATERQPENHQTSQSSICTAQVVLNASVAHPPATQHVTSELC